MFRNSLSPNTTVRDNRLLALLALLAAQLFGVLFPVTAAQAASATLTGRNPGELNATLTISNTNPTDSESVNFDVSVNSESPNVDTRYAQYVWTKTGTDNQALPGFPYVTCTFNNQTSLQCSPAHFSYIFATPGTYNLTMQVQYVANGRISALNINATIIVWAPPLGDVQGVNVSGWGYPISGTTRRYLKLSWWHNNPGDVSYQVQTQDLGGGCVWSSTTDTISNDKGQGNHSYQIGGTGANNDGSNPVLYRDICAGTNYKVAVRTYQPSTGIYGRWASVSINLNGDGTAKTIGRNPATVAGDFAGNGISDRAVWRPSEGTWFPYGNVAGVKWGLWGDVPIPGDYDGDGKIDFSVWRPSNGYWYLRGIASVQWGVSTDIPVPGDYNGDGKTDIAVWRPSNGTWYILTNGFDRNTYRSVQWGQVGDIPVPGDYDGDGKTDIAIWRPSIGTWCIIYSKTGNTVSIPWGGRGDIPVPGDYTGSGKTQLGIYRPSLSVWYIYGVGDYPYGSPGDVPVPGDYNGVGITNIAVWRPSNGTWWVMNGPQGAAWGASEDQPVTAPTGWLAHLE